MYFTCFNTLKRPMVLESTAPHPDVVGTPLHRKLEFMFRTLSICPSNSHGDATRRGMLLPRIFHGEDPQRTSCSWHRASAAHGGSPLAPLPWRRHAETMPKKEAGCRSAADKPRRRRTAPSSSRCTPAGKHPSVYVLAHCTDSENGLLTNLLRLVRRGWLVCRPTNSFSFGNPLQAANCLHETHSAVRWRVG